MTDTIREQRKLLNRVRRIRGQVEAVERAIVGGAGCGELMHHASAARGALGGLLAAIMETHIRDHLVERETPGCSGAAAELIEVVRSYIK